MSCAGTSCICLQLEEAQSALQQAKATDRSEELAAAEARARALQTSLHRKEGVVRDLHERVHSLTRWGAGPHQK